MDGFVMRSEERHRFVRKVKTVGERTISDHKPKKMVVTMKAKKWRRVHVRKKTPRINWEKLKVEEVEVRYKEVVERKMRERGEEVEEESTGWAKLQEVVVEAAKEVCGEVTKSVENPWMVGKEEEVRRLRQEIGRCLEEREAAQEEEEREGAKERLKEARKEWKREVTRWEKEWWEVELRRCEQLIA